MPPHAQSHRIRRGLLAACIVALLLILVLSILENRERGLGCAPLAPVAAEDREPEALDATQSSATQLSAESSATVTPAAGGEIVRGRVVDKRAHDGVPWITVEVRAGEISARCKTESNGWFTSPRPFPAGKIEIQVTDEDRDYGVTRKDWSALPDASRVEIEIDIGPSFLVWELANGTPSPSASWKLRLVQSPRPVASAGEIEVRDEELSLVEGPDLEWSSVPLRFEQSDPDHRSRTQTWAFARWPRVEFEPKPGWTPRVHVRSDAECVRGVTEVDKSIGTQTLPKVAYERFCYVSGNVVDPRRGPVKDAHVAFVLGERETRGPASVPDMPDVAAPGGSFQSFLYRKNYPAIIAWGPGYEPTRSRDGPPSSGRKQLDDINLMPLLRPSFVSSADVAVPDIGSMDERQFVRAWAAGTRPYARAVVYDWNSTEERAVPSCIETRYEVEVVGIDRAPQTGGRSWKQILPGPLTPDPAKEQARVHRIEWIDPLTNTPRFDYHIAAGPAGCMVTTREPVTNARFALLTDAAVQFTVWRPGCEPILLRTKDFAEANGERVAHIQPQPGWGVLIAFRQLDDDAHGDGGGGRAAHARGLEEQLASKALPGVVVTSISTRDTSDADGCVLVRSRMWPPRLSLRADGYRLVELQRMDGPGSRWIAFMKRER